MTNSEIKQQINEIKKFLICLHGQVEYKDEYIVIDDYYAICDLVAKWEKEINADEDSD